MELHEMVKEWLKEKGYDGLCNTDIECGCELDDFMPCGEPRMECQAGTKKIKTVLGNVYSVISVREG